VARSRRRLARGLVGTRRLTLSNAVITIGKDANHVRLHGNSPKVGSRPRGSVLLSAVAYMIDIGPTRDGVSFPPLNFGPLVPFSFNLVPWYRQWWDITHVELLRPDDSNEWEGEITVRFPCFLRYHGN
jgi:hypothetical protein